MGPPVRTVCVACLQSVDVSSGEGYPARADCPYCGHPNDLGRSGFESTTGDGFASPPPPDPDSLTPRTGITAGLLLGRIGRFVLREPLGEGGYGQVFRAFDPHLERDVALKILKPNRLGEKALERFYREARAAARLDHPNIVGLHDAGRDEDRCWIAYQLVPGQTLSRLRDSDRPSILATVRIIRDLALALDHAHGRRVFHRDLKPANVLIDDSGRARLTDFGLARRGDLDSDLTQEGTVLGTPQYMSPEAAAGRAHKADGRSDLYSLGVIFYELICGKRPADLPTNSPYWRSNRTALPPTPSSLDRMIPLELDRLCMRALAFDPDSRYPDARSFADALTCYLEERSGGYPSLPTTRRSGLAIGMIVVASALCLALGMSLHFATRRGATTTLPPPVEPIQAIKAPADSRPPAARLAPSTPARADVPHRPAMVVLNTETKKFHTRTCASIRDMHEDHRREIPYPDEEAISSKLMIPCAKCDPTREKASKGVASGR